jgi:hypothetical protein
MAGQRVAVVAPDRELHRVPVILGLHHEFS